MKRIIKMTGKKRKTKKIDVGEVLTEDHEIEDRTEDYKNELDEIEDLSGFWGEEKE